MTTITGVQRPEYDPEAASGTDLRWAPDGLYVHRDGSTAQHIPDASIIGVDVETDRSMAGFRDLATLFGLFGLLFTVPSVPMLLAGEFTPVATGLYISAALSWYGVWFCGRLEVGDLSVLRVETPEDQMVFLAHGRGAFEELTDQIRAGGDRLSSDGHRSGRR